MLVSAVGHPIPPLRNPRGNGGGVLVEEEMTEMKLQGKVSRGPHGRQSKEGTVNCPPSLSFYSIADRNRTMNQYDISGDDPRKLYFKKRSSPSTLDRHAQLDCIRGMMVARRDPPF